MFKRILVTGGAGFIGSWFIRYCLEHYPETHIVNLDALTYAGNLETLADVIDHPNHTFVQGDIRDEALVGRLMQDVEACINIAAQTHVDRSIESPQAFVETNVLGTSVLLEAARAQGLQKFVQVSTDEVYGSLDLDNADSFTENSPLAPSSPYSASKASADLLVKSYFETFGLPVCITRCSNNYGPYQFPEKLIPFFLSRLMQKQSVTLYGDGLNVRDWLHVRDHARALAMVLMNGQAGAIYNIGGNHERANLEIASLLIQGMGISESEVMQHILFVEDRLGHDRRYAIDASYIQAKLGWHPTIPFQAGLAETITWYQNNPAWIQTVLAKAHPAAPVAAL